MQPQPPVSIHPNPNSFAAVADLQQPHVHNTHFENGFARDPRCVAVQAGLGPQEDESKWVLDGIDVGWWWWWCRRNFCNLEWDCNIAGTGGGHIHIVVDDDCRDNRIDMSGRRLEFLMGHMLLLLLVVVVVVGIVGIAGIGCGLLDGFVGRSIPWLALSLFFC